MELIPIPARLEILPPGVEGEGQGEEMTVEDWRISWREATIGFLGRVLGDVRGAAGTL